MNSFLNHASLERRFVAAVGLGLLLFSLLGGASSYLYAFFHEIAEADTLQAQLVQTVQVQAEVAVFAMNEEIAEGVIQSLLVNPIIQAVRIQSADGFNVEASKQSNVDFSAGKLYLLLSPVDHQERVGSLVVVQNQSQVNKNAAIQAIPTALMMVIQIIIATLLLMALFRRLVGEPVARLAQKMKEMKPGHGMCLQVEERHQHDEIGLLSQCANFLLSTADHALAEERLLLEHLQESHQQLERRNKLIHDTFGRYLSDEVVNQILNTPEGLELGGEKLEVTIMMTDLRGFTAISEKMLAEDVVAMINIFLDEMIGIIFRHNGTINEFIGDAILVIFGAPIQREDDPLRGVACALEMQLAMEQVNQRNQQAGYPPVAMGIGLNTGHAVVGNIGSEQRKKYAVVGKNVNLTSRIESYTVGGQILISESTRQACGEALLIGGEMVVMPKGVEHPITISEVVGMSGRYQIQLPRKNLNLHPLSLPVAVQFSVLHGKNTSHTSYAAQLLEIGEGIGLFQSQHPLHKLDNLKLALLDDQGQQRAVGILGKVTEIRPTDPPAFVVNFSFLPQEAKDWLATLTVS